MEKKEKEKSVKEIAEDTEKFNCIIQKGILFLDEFLDGPMCSRCLPCPMGSYEMRIRFRKLAEGEGSAEDIEMIRRVAPDMLESSLCKKGKDTARFIIDTLENSPEIYEAHIEGRCPEKECGELFVYRIIPEKCVMCGDCKDVCKDYAILGEKKVRFLSGFQPFEIIEKRCTRCGECIKVCDYGAIEIIDIKETEPVEV